MVAAQVAGPGHGPRARTGQHTEVDRWTEAGGPMDGGPMDWWLGGWKYGGEGPGLLLPARCPTVPSSPALLGLWELVRGQRSAWSQRAEHLAPASGNQREGSVPRDPSPDAPFATSQGSLLIPFDPVLPTWWGGGRRHQRGVLRGAGHGQATRVPGVSPARPGVGSPTPCWSLGSCRARRALRGGAAVDGAWPGPGPPAAPVSLPRDRMKQVTVSTRERRLSEAGGRGCAPATRAPHVRESREACVLGSLYP